VVIRTGNVGGTIRDAPPLGACVIGCASAASVSRFSTSNSAMSSPMRRPSLAVSVAPIESFFARRNLLRLVENSNQQVAELHLRGIETFGAE